MSPHPLSAFVGNIEIHRVCLLIFRQNSINFKFSKIIPILPIDKVGDVWYYVTNLIGR